MIPMKEAVRIVMDSTQLLETTTVPLLDSLGYVLSAPVTSDINMPPFHKAAMDGFAVVGTDVVDASRANPVILEVVDEIQAGSIPAKSVSPGTAARIMTGAPMPEGSDTVVMVEETVSENGMVKILEPAIPGQNYVPLGEDVRKGDVVLDSPFRVRPPEIGIMAAVGATEVSVYRRPIVGVVATGDEIVEPDQTPASGQIRNSNGYSMTSQVVRAEGIPKYLGIAGDTVEDLRRVMTEGIETCDVLLLSGGVSAGVYDLVQGVMKDLGISVLFDQIRMKPGKPLTFGVRGPKLIFGLPGNPVSSVVGLELLVRPALRKMQAMTDCHRPRVSGRLQASFTQTPGREQFVPAFSEFVDGAWSTRWVGHHGSADLFSLSEANSLFIVDPDVVTVDAGETVDLILLEAW